MSSTIKDTERQKPHDHPIMCKIEKPFTKSISLQLKFLENLELQGA